MSIEHELRVDADWVRRIDSHAARAELMNKAADEIERLKSLLKECAEPLAFYEDKGPPGEGWHSDEHKNLLNRVNEAIGNPYRW